MAFGYVFKKYLSLVDDLAVDDGYVDLRRDLCQGVAAVDDNVSILANFEAIVQQHKEKQYMMAKYISAQIVARSCLLLLLFVHLAVMS